MRVCRRSAALRSAETMRAARGGCEKSKARPRRGGPPSGASRQLRSMKPGMEVVSSWRAVHVAAARVGAHEKRRHAKAGPPGRPDVVEPAARLVVGPHERRAVPGAAARQGRDHGPRQGRAGGDPSGRVLARARRRDVGDGGQPVAVEVLVELVEVDDVPRVSHRHAHRLRAAASQPRVVVLDVEPPRDATRLEPAEDPVHPESMVDDAAAGRRREEAVEQDVVLGDVPVERQVAVVVVAHHGAVDRLAVARRRTDEAVHTGG